MIARGHACKSALLFEKKKRDLNNSIHNKKDPTDTLLNGSAPHSFQKERGFSRRPKENLLGDVGETVEHVVVELVSVNVFSFGGHFEFLFYKKSDKGKFRLN
jgi:hypothetical protein